MANYNVRVNDITVLTTVANTYSAVADSLNQLRSSLRSHNSKVVGLDVEWNSNLTNSRVSVLQLCHEHRCLIIQILHLDSIPQSLKEFLADESISFVGVGISNDLARLRNDYGINCNSGKELGPMADRVYGKNSVYRDCGLVELSRVILGFYVTNPEHIRRSNWDAGNLSSEQISYATTDAYVSYAIGRKLLG